MNIRELIFTLMGKVKKLEASVGTTMVTRSGHVLTQADVTSLVTIHYEPWRYASYLPTPNAQISLTVGVKNKLLLPTTTVGTVEGFDLFVTSQGSALRFIGTGLGNGDSASFKFDAGFSSQAVGGAGADLMYEMVTRPYTETDFQNTVSVPGIFAPRRADNAKVGAVPMVAPPIVTLNDGDLLEFNVETGAATDFILDAFNFEIREVYKV